MLYIIAILQCCMCQATRLTIDHHLLQHCLHVVSVSVVGGEQGVSCLPRLPAQSMPCPPHLPSCPIINTSLKNLLRISRNMRREIKEKSRQPIFSQSHSHELLVSLISFWLVKASFYLIKLSCQVLRCLKHHLCKN